VLTSLDDYTRDLAATLLEAARKRGLLERESLSTPTSR
jgi:hypothetical protein